MFFIVTEWNNLILWSDPRTENITRHICWLVYLITEFSQENAHMVSPGKD